MGEIQALGEVVTGGLVGHAVEPATGRRSGHSGETVCLNCGTPLVGDYCHACGQRAHVHRTLRAFGQDFVTGVLNIEGKIFTTLPLLAWRPGDLTRRYIDGQRARFVSPLALFLFSVFLLFATIQSLGTGDFDKLSTGNVTYHSTAEAITGTQGEIRKLIAARAHAGPDSIKQIDADIVARRTSLETLERFKKEGVANAVLADPGAVKATSSLPWLNSIIRKARANPQLAFFKLQDAASKFAWLLIPISVPFLWLLFPLNRRFRLYDHTVFVTYSISFMILLLVASTFVERVSSSVAGFAWFVPPVHMYRQLRGAYDLSRGGAIWRTAALSLFAVIAVTLFALIILGVGTFS